MGYFLAALTVVVLSGILCGSWRKTFILPWIVVTVPMLLGAGFANLGLIPSLIAPWSDKTHILVIAGTTALFAGSFTFRHVQGQMTVTSNDVYWNERTALGILVFFTGIALLANTAQFLIAGQIPLFSADPDHARMAAGKNGYLHIFSVLSGHLIPITALILFTGNTLRTTTRKILAGVIAVNVMLLLLWVARGMLIYPVVTIIAMNFILDQHSYRLKKVLAVAVLCLVIVSGVKYLRDVVQFGVGYNPSEQRIAATGLQRGILANAAVLYLTIALNYEILNRYTAAVPLLAPHSSGRIMAGNLTAYLPGSGAPYTELDFQNTILKKNDKTLTLTSTIFGIPYLDFGLPGVLLISFFVGLLYRIVWVRMLSHGSPWSIFLYAYLISMAFFIPYAFMYTQVSFTWFLLSSFPIIFLCSCRVKGASLFRRKSRIAF